MRRIVRPAARRPAMSSRVDASRLGVHARRRLVEDQHLGVASEREGKREPLPLAAGQAANAGPRHAAEPDVIDERVRVARLAVEARRTAARRSRGVARGSRPPAWSISPTRARSAGPPLDGSTRRARGPCRHRPVDSPRRSRRVVVLPAPFGPRRATISPCPTRRSTPSRTARSPYRLTTPRTSMARVRAMPSRRGRRDAGDRGVQALELRLRDLADLDLAQDPVSIDEVRLRPGRDAVGRLDRAVGSTTSATSRRTPPRSRGPARADRTARTPTIASPSAACSASFVSNSGNSSRQGTQLGPQKFTITGRPRSEARSKPRRRGPCRRSPVPGWPRAIPVEVLARGARSHAAAARRPSVTTMASATARRIGRRRGSSRRRRGGLPT